MVPPLVAGHLQARLDRSDAVERDQGACGSHHRWRCHFRRYAGMLWKQYHSAYTFGPDRYGAEVAVFDQWQHLDRYEQPVFNNIHGCQPHYRYLVQGCGEERKLPG